MSGEKPLPLPDVLPGEQPELGGGLSIDLIPRGAGNLKQSLTPYKWKRLSKGVRLRAGWKCEACGAASADPKHADLTCHERWVWDEQAGWQRLARLMSLCLKCDAVTHYHHHAAKRDGDVGEMIEHLASVRGWSIEGAREYVRSQESEWERRSTVEWQMDRSILVSTGLISEKEAVEEAPELLARILDVDGHEFLEMSEKAEHQADLYAEHSDTVSLDLLFGEDAHRFIYVAYETGGRWVGVVRRPYVSAHADNLGDLENELLLRVAERTGVREVDVRLYSELLQGEFGEDVLIRALHSS